MKWPRPEFVIVPLLFVGQFLMILRPAGHDDYRLKERARAGIAWKSAPSTESRKALDNELEEWRRHRGRWFLAEVGFYTVVDCAVIVFFWKRRQLLAKAPPPPE